MTRRLRLCLCIQGFSAGLGGVSASAAHLGYTSQYVGGLGHGVSLTLLVLAWWLAEIIDTKAALTS